MLCYLESFCQEYEAPHQTACLLRAVPSNALNVRRTGRATATELPWGLDRLLLRETILVRTTLLREVPVHEAPQSQSSDSVSTCACS